MRPDQTPAASMHEPLCGGSTMAETIHDMPPAWTKRAFVDDAKYKAMYEASVRDPDAFWGEHGKRIDWIKPYTKVKNTSYDPHNVSIKWYEDGVLNVAA